MFSKNSSKGIVLFVSLTLFVLLLPVLPGSFSGLDQQPLDPAETVNLELEEPLQQEQAEADPTEPEKVFEQVGSKSDPALESGLKLLTTVTENSKSDFVASFNNDQQMIRDYAASAKKIATVALNPAAVAPGAFSPGDQIVVEVSEDKHYLVTVEDTSRDRNVDFVLGTVEGSLFGFFHMTTTEGQTRAVLRVPEENKIYHIAYSNSDHYHLFEFEITEFERYEDESLPPRIPEEIIPEEKQHVLLAEIEQSEHEPSGSQPETAGSPGTNDPATIDVMVVYTPASRTWAGGAAGITNEISQAMLRAQEALTNSNTGITMRLVHTAETSYTESGSISTDLYRLTGHNGSAPVTGYMEEVRTWRDTYGADLVALFPYNQSAPYYGGVGWLYYNDPAWGYSVSCITGVATTYLHIHEMGHNMGAHHHKLQNYQPGPHTWLNSYSAGWRFQVGGTWYNTLMSYSHGSYFSPGSPGAGITSIEVGYFSTPLINYPGSSVALGHAADGDNARLLRETKHGVAAFRSTAGPAISLGDAVDAPHLTWTTGGNANWFGQSATTHDGVDAAQSGPITHNQRTWMETTVTGPGTLTYWWKVSSESDYDFLEFYINGSSQSWWISGNTDWEQKSHTLSTGTNTLRWLYVKDGSVSSGSDCGWVDQVMWTPETAHTGSIQVNINPSEARTAGARWRLTSGSSSSSPASSSVPPDPPRIDLSDVPYEAMESNVLRIKFTPEMTPTLDQMKVTSSAEGIVLTGIKELDSISRRYSASALKSMLEPLYKISEASKQYRDRHRAHGLHLWYEIQIESGQDIKQIVSAYNNINLIEIAEPVYKRKHINNVELLENRIEEEIEDKVLLQGTWTPNDPRFTNQWHYHNTGQNSGTAGADIDLIRAWHIEKGNSAVIVAIVDDGIQYNHPDISANMWPNIGPDGTGTVPGNHGTHVAGTVAAVSNNSIGVSGIAGGSGSGNGVRLMSVDTFNGSLSHSDLLIYTYQADNGVAISQNSWGFVNADVFPANTKAGIDYFNTHGGGSVLNGGLVIFAAGNENSSGNWYPARYEGVMAVAATNNQDRKASYSNYGSWVEISAPGGETSSVTARGVLSTVANNGYAYYQGTSMACPHVTGVAALMVSHAPGQYTATEIRNMLKSSADNHYGVNPSYTGQLGSGRLNAYQALLSVQSDNWLNSGETLTAMAPGNYTITFNNVTGWTKPADISVTVGTGLVTRTGTYTDSNYTLTVNSTNPASGVAITSSSGHGGTTAYTQTVEQNSAVTLTAPEYVGSGADRKRFDRWSGASTSTNRTITLTMSENRTVTANYVDDPATHTLFVNSNNLTTGVAITSSTGHGGTTQYSRTLTTGTTATLTAPEYHGSGADRKRFDRWTGASISTNRTITLTMSENRTVTANYANAPESGTGSIQARIVPVGARNDGARWRLTTGPDTRWKNHNATISNLPAGTYTIRFKNVTGWTRPANIRVRLGAGDELVRRGRYVRR